MKTNRFPCGGTLAAAFTALALTAGAPAHAIMAGASPDTAALRVDANATTSSFAGVGSFSNGSGALVGSQWVLTAAHVASGLTVGSSSFYLNYGGNLTHSLGVAAVYLHPSYNSAIANAAAYNDLALVQLSSAAPAGVPIYGLYGTPFTLGTTDLTLVGYGGSGNGDVGATVAADGSVKRTGENVADAYFTGSGNQTYMFDFDGGSAPNAMGGGSLGNTIETNLVGGDSGGGAFLFDGANWLLAGVNTFNGSVSGGPAPPLFGSIGGGMVVSTYSTWINSTISPVPEPSTWAMLLGGLGMLGWAARRRTAIVA